MKVKSSTPGGGGELGAPGQLLLEAEANWAPGGGGELGSWRRRRIGAPEGGGELGLLKAEANWAPEGGGEQSSWRRKWRRIKSAGSVKHSEGRAGTDYYSWE